MRYKRLHLSLLLSLGFGLAGVQAQTSTNTTGGNASGSGGSVSYSVGQVFYNTTINGAQMVAQGVQVPYEISVITGIEGVEDIDLSVSAYPNPAVDYLILDVKDRELVSLHFQVYDMKGKLVKKEKITRRKTNIVMSNLLPATYFVKVMQGKKEVKGFKIVKIQ